MRIHAVLTTASCRGALSRVLLLVFVTVLAAACSSGSPTQPTPVPPPPVMSLTCPSDIDVESTDGEPVNVTWPTVAPTGGLEPITVACGAPEGNMFPVGDTRVECRASDTALQQASCAFTVTVTRQPQLTRVDMLAFGDSITAGVVSDPMSAGLAADGFPSFILNLRPHASYPTRLLERLRERYQAQSEQLRIDNYGVPGERIENGVGRLSNDLLTRRPEVLLLLHGANNMTGPLANSRSFIIARLDEMMTDARFRGARVFVATMPPPRPSGRNAIPLSLVLDLNHHIRLTAQGQGAVLVDVYGALAPDVNRYMGVDGLHPTEDGYRRMADEFFEAIRQELEVR